MMVRIDRLPRIAKWVILMMLTGWIAGCSMITGFFESAPIEDETFLTYDLEDGVYLEVAFSKIGGDTYAAVETVTVEREEEDLPGYGFEDEVAYEPPEPEEVRTIVNKRLYKESGAPYQPGRLGPLWVAPSNIREGGSAHGAYFEEIKKWKGWDVGVVSASFGRGGAVTGGWYYEKKTGLLVGGYFATVMEDDPEEFTLVDTSIKSLKL